MWLGSGVAVAVAEASAAALIQFLLWELPWAAGAAVKSVHACTCAYTHTHTQTLGVLLLCSGLKIRHCHCSGLGLCYGAGLIPHPGTAEKKKLPKVTTGIPRRSGITSNMFEHKRIRCKGR